MAQIGFRVYSATKNPKQKVNADTLARAYNTNTTHVNNNNEQQQTTAW